MSALRLIWSGGSELFNGHIKLDNLSDTRIEFWELTVETNFDMNENSNSWSAPTVESSNAVHKIKGTRNSNTHEINANSSRIIGFSGFKTEEPEIYSASLTEIVVNESIVIGIPEPAAVFVHDGYTIEYTIMSESGNSQEIEVTIINTGTEVIENWMLAYNRFYGNVGNISGAVIEQVDLIVDPLLLPSLDMFGELPNKLNYVRNTGDNASIALDEAVSFSYTLTDFTGVPDMIDMCQTRVTRESDYIVNVVVDDEDGTNFTGSIVIENQANEPLEFWELTINANFTIDEIDEFFSSTPVGLNDDVYEIKGDFSENTHIIEANSIVAIDFSGSVMDIPEIFENEITAVVLNEIFVTEVYFGSTPSYRYGCGDVNGDGRITINDSLEILKYLARLDSVVVQGTPHYDAAIIHPAAIRPSINCALEILKHLAKTRNFIDDEYATRKFEGNGNTVGTAPENIYVFVSERFTLPEKGDLAKEGHVFSGWRNKGTGTCTSSWR
jgi:hypothetical protein